MFIMLFTVDCAEHFRDSMEALRKCSEEGIACGYGICDECPVTSGLQMRFNFGEETEK